jgi:hypothetical protein
MLLGLLQVKISTKHKLSLGQVLHQEQTRLKPTAGLATTRWKMLSLRK